MTWLIMKVRQRGGRGLIIEVRQCGGEANNGVLQSKYSKLSHPIGTPPF